MNRNHSYARPTYEYKPTIIESGLLIRRFGIQLEFLENELKRSWIDFKTAPSTFITRSAKNLFVALKKFLSTPNNRYACATALMAITCLVMLAFVVQSASSSVEEMMESSTESGLEVVLRNVAPPPPDPEIGKSGGNGLGESQKTSRETSGGGGGDRNPLPAQFGKPPQPSIIPAPIPITPPINPPTLPVAGINIDPSQWKDVEARVYGDPSSKSTIPSSGSGEGGGIGTGKGTGIGPGEGSGLGRGSCKDIDLLTGRRVCPDSGGRSGSGPLTASQVDQRARVLSKPEPQYTEEARQNQVIGTVMLRVVFSSEGQVDQIRAVRSLPFGLTERAIAAARQIKFVPAMKDGHAVSVHMQLEYNFNLY